MAKATKPTAKNSSTPLGAADVEVGKKALEKFNQYCEQFNVAFPCRETEVKMLKYAVLLGGNVLFKGEPGVAKTALSKQFFKHIQGSRLFSQQFTAYMDEAFVFGPTLLEELKQGRVIHNIENTLADCEFAVLDEFYNASEELLVSCNSLLNEKEFDRIHQKVSCPLITAVAMTNHMTREKDPAIKPLHDRFMFVSEVHPIKDPFDRLRMYHNSLRGKLTEFDPIDMETVQQARDYVTRATVIASKPFLYAYDELFRKAKEALREHKFLSDRKAERGLRFCKAISVNEEGGVPGEETLSHLRLIFTDGNNANQTAAFDQVLGKVRMEFQPVFKWHREYMELTVNNTGNAQDLSKSYERLSPLHKDLLHKEYKELSQGLEEIKSKKAQAAAEDEETVFRKDPSKKPFTRNPKIKLELED